MKTQKDKQEERKEKLIDKYYLDKTLWKSRSYLELIAFFEWKNREQPTMKRMREVELMPEDERAVIEDDEFGEDWETENGKEIRDEISIVIGALFLTGGLVVLLIFALISLIK